jgi:hypothetical protein
MPQVYQVSYKSSPWSKLHDPGPSVTCTKCTRSLIHHHPGPYLHDPGPSITCTKSIINYHPGPSCISQGLLSHLPSVPGLLYIIILAHICMTQGLLLHTPSVPGLSAKYIFMAMGTDLAPPTGVHLCPDVVDGVRGSLGRILTLGD